MGTLPFNNDFNNKTTSVILWISNVPHPKTEELCFPPKWINIDITVYIYIYINISNISNISSLLIIISTIDQTTINIDRLTNHHLKILLEYSSPSGDVSFPTAGLAHQGSARVAGA